MSGETNLDQLLSNMSPELRQGDYVFCVSNATNYDAINKIRPFACIYESEGMTLVVLKETAHRFGLDYEQTFGCITLNVHSSLEAVGLTAAVSTALTDHQISANIIAGFYHDHIFVPTEFAARALDILSRLSN